MSQYLSFFYLNNNINDTSKNTNITINKNKNYEKIIYYIIEFKNSFDENLFSEIDTIIKNLFLKSKNNIVYNSSFSIQKINNNNKLNLEDKYNLINLNDIQKLRNVISLLNFKDGYNCVYEWGTLFRIETPWSSNFKTIINNLNLDVKLIRIESYKRSNDKLYYQSHFDKITQSNMNAGFIKYYLDNKKNNINYEKNNDGLQIINIDYLEEFNKKNNLGFDVEDLKWLKNIYKDLGRSLNKVELYDLAQSNSEHSRHWFFRGKFLVYNDEQQKYNEYLHTLFNLVKQPLIKNKNNSVIAFCDDASCIEGYYVYDRIYNPNTNQIKYSEWKVYPTLTAETHNFPTGISPFEGANTGVGGRIRDTLAIGKGGDIVSGIAGYSVGNLHLEDYDLPWEDNSLLDLDKLLHLPYKILIEASNGASDYGNKIGEPIINGFTRTFGDIINKYENTVNYNSVKPIMFSAGLGVIYSYDINWNTNDLELDLYNIKKEEPNGNDSIYQVGGLAYPIGMGGGSSSSMGQTEIDFSNAVQRGDPEMGSRVVSFLRNVYQSRENIIKNIHDQGAGGPGNVLKEITEPLGGNIYMHKIPKGCDNMSILESWCSEYQEQMSFLVSNSFNDTSNILDTLSKKENVNCYEVGIINNVDASSSVHVFNDTKELPIMDFPLDKVLINIPQKTFLLKKYMLKNNIQQIEAKLNNFVNSLNINECLSRLLKLPSISSKKYLVNKVDRSVSGKISQQQCIGANQIPLSNYSCISLDMYPSNNNNHAFVGSCTGIGEKPLIGFGCYKKMSIMSVGEMITNMMGIYIGQLENIKCSANWMWSPKKSENEGYNLLSAVESLSSVMCNLGIAIDGGKDSLSMHTDIDNTTYYSLPTLVLTGYSTVPDIKLGVTPLLSNDNESILVHIPINNIFDLKNNFRLGGSCLLQVFNNLSLSNEENTPTINDIKYFKNIFTIIQNNIKKENIYALHDISDGGLLLTLLEMSFCSNIGININIISNYNYLNYLFSEELGFVIQINKDIFNSSLEKELGSNNIYYNVIGNLNNNHKISLKFNNEVLLNDTLVNLRYKWELTSFELEKKQSNIITIQQEIEYSKNIYNYQYKISENIIKKIENYNRLYLESLSNIEYDNENINSINVLVLRAPGSNGYREMNHVLNLVGFNVYDFTITELMEINDLYRYNGIVFVGGFSFGDIPYSGIGWATLLKDNNKINSMFEEFKNRKDTFTLGVCNGCQVQSYLNFIDIPFRMRHNNSNKFESRWSQVKIKDTNIFTKGLDGLEYGIWSAHGEGKFDFINTENINDIMQNMNDINFMNYIDLNGKETEHYPENPNGSINGICGINSNNGRHLAVMPHPERCYYQWQIPYLKNKKFEITPWYLFFKNAYIWCKNINQM